MFPSALTCQMLILFQVLTATGDVVGVTPQYDAVKDMWTPFAQTGKLGPGSTGPSPVLCKLKT